MFTSSKGAPVVGVQSAYTITVGPPPQDELFELVVDEHPTTASATTKGAGVHGAGNGQVKFITP